MGFGIGRKRIRRAAPAWAALALVGAAGGARADEPLFGYVNTTDLLPKGKGQVEQWLTDRAGQAGGTYARLEGRSEAEYGLRDNLQLTLYLNYDYVDADRNSTRGLTEGLGVRPGHSPLRPYARGRLDGATAEVIWRLVSPYLSPVGVAILAETTVGPGEAAGRLRGIVQKNFRDDTVVVAANLWAELEHRPAATPGAPARPKVTTLELDLGASYRIAPNWSVGLEYRRHGEYAGYGFDGPSQFVADYAGPVLHYGGRRWFATLTAMRQLGARIYDPTLQSLSADGLVYATRSTRWDGLRLRIGRTF